MRPWLRFPANGIRTSNIRNLPVQVADEDSLVVEIPGEWNSRLHKRNLPPQVEEIYRIPGEWNSRRLSFPIKNGASPKPAPPQIMLLLLINPTAPEL